MTGSNSEHSSTKYATPIPISVPNPTSQQASPSPFIPPQDYCNRQDSYSSISTNHHNHSISTSCTSSTTSPALGPAVYDYARSITSVGSALTSPALIPQNDRDQRDLDEEASAALLMLNSDRRGTFSSVGSIGSVSGVRGMSVRDLLSS